MTDGSDTNSFAILVRFFSPPDNPLTKLPPISVDAHRVKPMSLTISFALFLLLIASPLVVIMAENSTDSSTVCVSSNLSSCCTYDDILKKSVRSRLTSFNLT